MSNARRIEIFVEDMWQPIATVISTMMKELGFKVVISGTGLDVNLHISKGDKSINYVLYNTLMEIATIDRDDNPLVFDEKLLGKEYFFNKAEQVLKSKILVILPLLLDEDGVEKVKNIKGYERIKIWEIDAKKWENLN